MAKFRVEMVDGRAYEVEAPEGTPQETLFAAIQERYPLAFKSTEELESAKSAPFRAADIAKSAKMGLAGGVQSLTDIFGAGNVASQYLQEAQQEAFKGLSPERIAEIERREELKKRAEGKGLGREIGASVGAFTEAPAQTLAQALFSSAPIIASAAIPGGQAAGAARLLAAARGPTAVGAAMGLGGQKGQDYETVKRELLSQGIPEEEAEQRAQKAAEYSAQNILRQAGAAAAGAVEGRFGVEPAVGRLLSRRTIEGGKTPPTWSQAIGQSVLGEAAPEALQAAVGTIGTNQALDQAGIPTELSRGLAGTVAHDALVGAVLGLGLSPAQKANLSRDYEADRAAERKKFEDEERAKIEEIARKQQEEYERKGYQEVRKAFAPQDLTKNPLGTFKAQDLSPAVVEYLDNFRAQSGLPKLKEYSIEDIADAMPGREPAKEKEALAQFVGERAGYTPDSQVTVQTVLDEALRKNIDIDARSFTDFLGRATGVNDIREMMPQQLFAAYKSLSALPESPTIREIEGGTNATRFDQAQYESALNGIDALLAELGRPASLPAVNEEIKRTTGLKSGKAIQSLLDEAIRRGDLDEVQTPRYRTIVPETGEIVGAIYDTREEAEKAAPKGAEVQEVTQRAISSPSATARLPEGYDIREGLLQTGEAPQAYDVMAGDQILNRVKSEEEAQTKLESYAKTRAAETENARKVIDKQNARLTKSQENLNLMQVEGRGRTNVYQQAIAKHQKLTDEVNQIIAKQNERIRKFDPDTTPLSIAPVGAKAVGKTGFTVLKDGAPVATFPTREKAESSILEGLPTSRLEELTREKVRRGIGPKAQKELERRAGKEKPEQVTKLEADLRKVLNKFGLKDVSLEVAEAIDGGKAGGSYLNSLIKVALDEANPVRTLRHESLHALRDLGFFTDQQWKALTNQAKSKWIDTYLKQKNIDGQPLRAGETSRYEAYVSAYMGDMDSIIEEAVADAFADFDANKAPPGMIAAILKKLNDFFTALRNALNGAGYQTAEDVFGKIERAELTPSAKAQGRMQERLARRGERYATTEPKQPSVRPSLRGGEGKQEEGAGGRDRGRRFTGRGLAPLAGAPIIQGATGPDPRLVAVAQQYAEKIGIPFRRPVAAKKAQRKRLSLRAPQTPEFKRWFGRSKVVDEGGEPKIMYHGTAGDFEAFRPGKADAIFVSPNAKFVESFGGYGEDELIEQIAKQFDQQPERKRSLLIPLIDDAIADKRLATDKNSNGLYGTTREELIDRFMDSDLSNLMGSVGIGSQLRDALENELPSRANIIPVYVKSDNPFDYENTKHVNQVARLVQNNVGVGTMFLADGSRLKTKDLSQLLKEGSWRAIESEDVQDAIRSLGFDAFHIKEGTIKNLAVYNPNQLKSVFNQRPTERPEMRFNLRANIDPSLMAMVDRVTPERIEKTWVQSITEAIAPKSYSHFRQQALNRYNRLGEAEVFRSQKMGGPIRMAEDNAESAALMSDNAAGVAASALGVHDRAGGAPVYRNGVTSVWNDNGNIKGPVAIFAPLAKYNNPDIYRLYQFWAGSTRARRLLDQGKERLYTAAEITRAKELLQQFPEFEQIQKEWIKYNNALVDYGVATGVLTPEKAAEFKKYSDYIPFYRQLDGERTAGPKIFQSISGVKPPKKIKGGEQPLDDLIETVVRNTQSMIEAGMKNVAAQKAVNLAADIGLATRLPSKQTREDVVTVLERGVEVSYEVADRLFIDAVKSLNLPDLPFIGLLSGPANLLRNLVTKDPGFMLANMMRDSMAAWVTSGVKMVPVTSTVINFGKAIAGRDPVFLALLNAGIIGGYEFSQNVKAGAAEMEKAMNKVAGVGPKGAAAALKPFTSLWDALERGTTASDAATRMEVYKQTMAETGNEAEALFRALEVMNFNRKGSSPVIRILTAAIPFLNARMQGLDVLYRASFGRMVNKDAATIQKAFFVRGMTIAALSCMYWALTHDDDEYKKQEEETKDNNWLIPSLGIKIPIPFEVGVLFKVVPERIMAYAFGTDTGKDFLDSMSRQLVSTLVINPIPQAALPVVEAVTNYSFFTQREIIGQGLKDVEPKFQVGPSTSLVSQTIGESLGISPMKLDHIIKGYTGTMGMYMIDMLDAVMDLNSDSPRATKRFEQLPVIKRFAVDPEARGNVTAYYDLKNSVDTAVRTSNLLERTQNLDNYGPYRESVMGMLATRDYVLNLEKTMKELREIKILIRSSDMSGDDKRDALLEINRREDQLVENIREIRNFARP